MIKTILFFVATFVCLAGTAQQEHDFNMPVTQPPPFSTGIPEITDQPSFESGRQLLYPKREFRCAWIATVYNIDYPSNTGLSVSTMKSEFIALLNKLKTAGINAVFVQIRPSCDAFYNSPYEPWSEWLSGTQGVAPAGGYDPLVFMIDEAHQRGIEFHAWLNPYRAVVSTTSSSIASNHVSVLHPTWCVTYNSLKLLDPGLPQVRDYVTMVVSDIVTRYNLDGIHFDDYFYPYPSGGATFNDNATFSVYPRGFTNIDNWRRDNVNLLVAMVNDSIKSIKSYVKFGVGPFGIWKNGVPAGITGLSSYYDIYCDPIAWLNNQSIDYVAPQLYWKIGTNQDFNTLVDWWGTQANNKGRHCYAGMASYQLNANGGNWAVNDILNQITSTRLINFKAQGKSFFSSTSIKNNMKYFSDSLVLSFNKYNCLIPTMPWIDSVPPLPPVNVTYTTTSNNVTLNWQTPLAATDGDTAKYFVLYRSTDGSSVNTSDSKQILYVSPYPITSYTDNIVITSFPGVAYAITSCDKLHNESAVEYINVSITVPANDNCSAAQNLSPDITCIATPGDISNPTPSGVPAPTCDNFNTPALLDIWYKFTATAASHVITIDPSNDFDPVLSVYTSCASGEIDCSDNGGPGVTENLSSSGLTIGTTYYVRTYDYGSIGPSTTTFDICVTGPGISTSDDEAQGNKSFTVDLFPNPLDGSILYGTFTGSGADTKHLTVQVYDIFGRSVFNNELIIKDGNFSLSFDEALKPGIYMVSGNNGNVQFTIKIVMTR